LVVDDERVECCSEVEEVVKARGRKNSSSAAVLGLPELGGALRPFGE
jgi:hypothetical protein